MVKVEIRAYNQIYDISQCIANIDDIEVTLERDGIDAVYKKTTFDFEFVDEAYNILDNIFTKYRQFSNVSILVYQRNVDFSYSSQYEQYDLDFLTFQKTIDTITISARDRSLQAIIKAKENVTYDINVDEIKDTKVWEHWGIKLFNLAIAELSSVSQMPTNDAILLNNPRIRFDSDKITIGGSYGTGDILIQDYLEAGLNRPDFLLWDFDEINGIATVTSTTNTPTYSPLWTAIRDVSGKLILRIRGLLAFTWGFKIDGSTNVNDSWNYIKSLQADIENSTVRAIFEIIVWRQANPLPFNQCESLVSFFSEEGANELFQLNPAVGSTQGVITYPIGYQGDNMNRGAGYTLGTYVIKIGATDNEGNILMPDCFPNKADNFPIGLSDDTYLTLELDNVQLYQGDTLWINMKLDMNNIGNHTVTDLFDTHAHDVLTASHIRKNLRYTSAWNPQTQQIEQFDTLISSRFDNNIILAQTPVPNDDPTIRDYYVNKHNWSVDRPSWIQGEVTFDYRASMPVANFNVISPFVLLQRLVDNMTQYPSAYETGIENMNTDINDLDMLIAGESLIKNPITPPQIHISFDNFKNWLATLGYSLMIDDIGVYFITRTTAFNKTINTQDITDIECEDLIESINDDLMYSSVRIGYNKQTYDGKNARLEFNGEFNYSIDSTLSTQELQLLSPVRADSLGMEIKWIQLLSKTTSDTASTESDKDVFVVNLKDTGTVYLQIITHYQDSSGNSDNIDFGQYNWKYNPRHLMKRNIDLIASSGLICRFASSSANSDFYVEEYDIIDNISELVGLPDNIDLSKAIMYIDPIIYDFAVGTFRKLPEKRNWSGLITFAYNGKLMYGFIKEISKFISMNQQVQYQLYRMYDRWKENLPPIISTADIFRFSGDEGVYRIAISILNSFNPVWKITDNPDNLFIMDTTNYTSSLFIHLPDNDTLNTRNFSITVATQDDSIFRTIQIIQGLMTPQIFIQSTQNISVLGNVVSVDALSRNAILFIGFKGALPQDLIDYSQYDDSSFITVTIDNSLHAIGLQIEENSTVVSGRTQIISFGIAEQPKSILTLSIIQSYVLSTIDTGIDGLIISSITGASMTGTVIAGYYIMINSAPANIVIQFNFTTIDPQDLALYNYNNSGFAILSINNVLHTLTVSIPQNNTGGTRVQQNISIGLANDSSALFSFSVIQTFLDIN
jgi:hypothetical protein